MCNASKNNQQKGFSLVELLLTVGVLGFLLLLGGKFFDDFARQVAVQEEASYLITVQEAAESFVTANFIQLWTSPSPNGLGQPNPATYTDTDANGVIENADVAGINLNARLELPIQDTAAGPFLTEDGVFLPETFSDVSRLKRAVKVILVPLGIISEESTIAVITVTDERILPSLLLREIAEKGGAQLGYVDEQTAPEIRSGFRLWSISTTDLVGVYDPDIDSDGGQSAAYGQISFSETFDDDFLYRVVIPGNDDANRMETNLDMNNNDIVNTDIITADNVFVAGNADILGGRADGDETINALLVDEVLRVNGANHQILSGLAGDASCAQQNLYGAAPVDTFGCQVNGGNIIVNDGVAVDNATQHVFNINTLDVRQISVQGDLESKGAVQTISGGVTIAGSASFGDISVTDTGIFSEIFVNGSAEVNNLDRMQASNHIQGDIAVDAGGSARAALIHSPTIQANGGMIMEDDLQAASVNVTNSTNAARFVARGGLNSCTTNRVVVPEFNPSGTHVYNRGSYDCLVGP